MRSTVDPARDDLMTAGVTPMSCPVEDTGRMRVLIVEDEPRMADVIRRTLVKDGAAADVAADGDEALELATIVDYDAILLDVLLPGRSGFDVCRVLRDRGVWAPVLMLTALDAVHDRVAGLDSGADDYLTKPFALAELRARLRALARRGRPERPSVLTAGDLTLDPARHEVRRSGQEIELSPREFALLETLMRRRGEVLSRLELIESAWDFAYENRSNVIDVYVRRLRRKIDDPFGTVTIETVRGAGYRVRDAP
jgi:two-component system, OmpR family, response regulator